MFYNALYYYNTYNSQCGSIVTNTTRNHESYGLLTNVIVLQSVAPLKDNCVSNRYPGGTMQFSGMKTIFCPFPDLNYTRGYSI